MFEDEDDFNYKVGNCRNIAIENQVNQAQIHQIEQMLLFLLLKYPRNVVDLQTLFLLIARM